MRLSQQTWPTLVSEVRLGRETYRVVRPARASRHGMLWERTWGLELSVDRATALTVAMAWGLAARSPNSLVYLPLRQARPAGSANRERLLDLVLLHHRLGFPASRWKQVRARLGAGRPHRVSLPPTAWRPSVDHRRSRHREFRDHLRWDVAADTLFLTGSRPAFEEQLGEVRDLVEEGPAHRAQNPGAHCCAEIGIGSRPHTDRRHAWAELHVEWCTPHG
ncbi:hypothetical protein FDA94_36285 [Herbidospora galbida]|uniref:Uncharacterized protein n=1 Tax=Herbidospora galbida TaxID=2575442 RepID=A0A4U3LU19_9ACTN|nr:hypothetical protein [Herbidospora galbida]TKK78979.1 hypothetical protein FDA94_36285 [Herbidospora galbida]